MLLSILFFVFGWFVVAPHVPNEKRRYAFIPALVLFFTMPLIVQPISALMHGASLIALAVGLRWENQARSH